MKENTIKNSDNQKQPKKTYIFLNTLLFSTYPKDGGGSDQFEVWYFFQLFDTLGRKVLSEGRTHYVICTAQSQMKITKDLEMV